MKNLAFAAVGAVLVAFVAGPASAQDTSTAVGVKGIDLLTETNSFVSIMGAEIHMAQQKDINVNISIECGLMTRTIVRSKGKKADDNDPDLALADATVKIRVVVYDDTGTKLTNVSVLPAFDLPGDGVVGPVNLPVTYCKRTQELTAALQGFIENSSCFDEITGKFDTECEDLYEEEIGLMLNTMTANSFNFIVENLDAGTYVIQAEAEIDTCLHDIVEPGCYATDGSESNSAAFIGLGSMVLNEVRLGNDVKNN